MENILKKPKLKFFIIFYFIFYFSSFSFAQEIKNNIPKLKISANNSIEAKIKLNKIQQRIKEPSIIQLKTPLENQSSDLLRLSSELGGGGFGLSSSLFFANLRYRLLSKDCLPSKKYSSCQNISHFIASLPVIITAPFSATTGIYYGGKITGGTGSYWSTFLGSSIGSIMGFLFYGANYKKNTTLAISLYIMPIILGGILGYETSHSTDKYKTENIFVTPSISLLKNGFNLGFQGIF